MEKKNSFSTKKFDPHLKTDITSSASSTNPAMNKQAAIASAHVNLYGTP